ncbi:hypothetical protein M2360_000092 [Rhizobium sp. SG_E_25_P2]|nr:hypothetical protein [Rhizobium sp. SG_E_25_P2]
MSIGEPQYISRYKRVTVPDCVGGKIAAINGQPVSGKG